MASWSSFIDHYPVVSLFWLDIGENGILCLQTWWLDTCFPKGNPRPPDGELCLALLHAENS